MSQEEKPRKAVRTPLPEVREKAKSLRIRVTPEELRAIDAKAKGKKQTMSEWIRSTLSAALRR